MEKWRFIEIKGLPNEYQISNYGNIRHLDYGDLANTKQLSQQRSTRGGMQVNFRIDGKNKVFDVHRLVVQAFKGFTPNKIIHIDGDKTNNKLSNITQDGFDYKQAHKDLYSMESQEWRDIPGYEGLYQVSDKGLVRSIKAYKNNECRKMMYLKLSEMESRTYVRLSNNKGVKTKVGVNRLVASAFMDLDLKDKKTLVMHIDKNCNNNCVENLRLHKIKTKKKLFGLF